MSTYYAKQFDTRPLTATLRQGNRKVIDLSGPATVRFLMREESGTVLVDGDCDVVGDGTAGKVSYSWEPAETDEPGIYRAEFRITFPDDSVETVPSDGYSDVVITPALAV